MSDTETKTNPDTQEEAKEQDEAKEQETPINKDVTLDLHKELVTLSGKIIKQLRFDFESLTPADYRMIVRLEAKLKGNAPNIEYNVSKSTSSEFRMGTAWVAAVKGTKNLCFDDIDRLSMFDLLALEEPGSYFIYGVLE